jgi:zinc D-Ala-D-Ala carboxypeptidase
MAYFHPEEFLCRCGRVECDALTSINGGLLWKLEQLRAQYGKPIVVTSGLRCRHHNQQSGGEPESGHLHGTEVDIRCFDSPSRYALLSLAFPLFPRVGIASSFLHLGISPSLPNRVCWLY